MYTRISASWRSRDETRNRCAPTYGFMWGHPFKKLLFSWGREFGRFAGGPRRRDCLCTFWMTLAHQRPGQRLVRDLQQPSYRATPPATCQVQRERTGFDMAVRVAECPDHSVIAWSGMAIPSDKPVSMITNFTPGSTGRLPHRPAREVARGARRITDAAIYGGRQTSNMAGSPAQTGCVARASPPTRDLSLPPLSTACS